MLHPLQIFIENVGKISIDLPRYSLLQQHFYFSSTFIFSSEFNSLKVLSVMNILSAQFKNFVSDFHSK